ncbi:MAG: hypothetical protein MMC33_010797 [Icmadophila ericetorum]|nr:hypothetical protein [Icmadophila ericetorum]
MSQKDWPELSIDELLKEWSYDADNPLNDASFDPNVSFNDRDLTDDQASAEHSIIYTYLKTNFEGQSSSELAQLRDVITVMQEKISALEEVIRETLREKQLAPRELIEGIENMESTVAGVEQEVLRQRTCLDLLHVWWEEVAKQIGELGNRHLSDFEPKSPLDVFKAHGFHGEGDEPWQPSTT